MRVLLSIAGILLCTGSLQAQPSFDCARAGSKAEEMICADPDLAALDRRMADRYAAARAVVAGLDSGSVEADGTLRASQRGWIRGRDECWKAGDVRGCIEDAYLIREVELVAMWLLEPPVGIATFICDEMPAKAVAVFFFATERPGIRVEYGDGIRAGWLVPAASGSKYETSFGGSFWQKGSDALFSWDDGGMMSCAMAR